MSVSWQIVLAADTSQQQLEQSRHCVTFAWQKDIHMQSNFIVCVGQEPFLFLCRNSDNFLSYSFSDH